MPEIVLYKDLLKLPKWQQRRLEILNRDKWECKYCGNKEDTLHVHHKEYIKGLKPWEYPDENFISLCEHCHDVLEFCKKVQYDIIGCTITRFKDGSKVHLISVSDFVVESGMQFCLIWEFQEGGECNGKNLIFAVPFKWMNTINELIITNTKTENGQG